MLKLRIFVLTIISSLALSVVAQADNITIFDKLESTTLSYGGHDYQGINTGREDDETEYLLGTGVVTLPYQEWDLEGVFLTNNLYLSMVGGYNFRTGTPYGGHDYTSGDIFLDIKRNGIFDAEWGNLVAKNADPQPWPIEFPHNEVLNTTLHWDYAIRLNFGTTNTYTVMELTSSTVFLDTTDVGTSNPWRVKDGQNLRIVKQGIFSFQSGLTDAQTGFSDWDKSGTTNHTMVSGINLGFLDHGQEFISHFTMECGNDLLVGQGTKVPEPTTLVLLGIGLAGAGVTARRKRKN